MPPGFRIRGQNQKNEHVSRFKWVISTQFRDRCTTLNGRRWRETVKYQSLNLISRLLFCFCLYIDVDFWIVLVIVCFQKLLFFMSRLLFAVKKCNSYKNSDNDARWQFILFPDILDAICLSIVSLCDLCSDAILNQVLSSLSSGKTSL